MEISDAKQVLEQAKEKMHKAVEYLDNELGTYRVGKANPSVFAGLAWSITERPHPWHR